MHVIDHRQHRAPSRGHRKMRRAVLWLTSFFTVFVVANIGMALAYNGKALPHYTVGPLDISGKSYAAIDTILQNETLPDTITLTKDAKSQKVPVTSLGIQVDKAATTKSVKHKPLVPLLALIMHHTVPLVLQADPHAVAMALESYDTAFSQAATDKHVAFEGGTFVSKNAAPGYGFDEAATAPKIINAVASGKPTVTIATKIISAGDNSGDLTDKITALKKQLQTKVTLTYGTQKIQPTANDMGAWYASDGNTMSIADANTSAYLDSLGKQLGIRIANKDDLITAIRYVMGRNLNTDFRVVATTGSVTRTYCTAADGAPEAELPDLIGKLAATYADIRGWNDGGLIAFKHVTSGCTYHVILTAPSRMTSYGAICDDYYNCQVGNSVLVNNDRWLYATDPWNKTGQNLETYRLLIINHETGHRLGFRDNPTCPGAGQPAPVMMQQSIDLKGCVFNTWPLQTELETLKTVL